MRLASSVGVSVLHLFLLVQFSFGAETITDVEWLSRANAVAQSPKYSLSYNGHLFAYGGSLVFLVPDEDRRVLWVVRPSDGASCILEIGKSIPIDFAQLREVSRVSGSDPNGEWLPPGFEPLLQNALSHRLKGGSCLALLEFCPAPMGVVLSDVPSESVQEAEIVEGASTALSFELATGGDGIDENLWQGLCDAEIVQFQKIYRIGKERLLGVTGGSDTLLMWGKASDGSCLVQLTVCGVAERSQRSSNMFPDMRSELVKPVSELRDEFIGRDGNAPSKEDLGGYTICGSPTFRCYPQDRRSN